MNVWMLKHGEFLPVAADEQHGVPSRFTLWGIVNVTTDSFFDGGTHATAEKAEEHALSLFHSGARILDIGGSSTRPGSVPVPAEEESRRIQPVLSGLNAFRSLLKKPAMEFSVDTWRASVAAMALENGADIINDVSGFAWDPELLSVIVQYSPGYVLTHCPDGCTPANMQSPPSFSDAIGSVCGYFEKKLSILVKSGLSEDHIILDPGIGFGKNAADNFKLLAGIDALFRFGRPVLMGLSNKSLFGSLLGLGLKDRTEATDICTALLASRGVFHHRVHNIEGAKNALILTEKCTEQENE